ncbi:NADH-quinone oxidoreductase subunit NuoN [Plastoroseomonas hellenica]|uniref:NADH-quinone oxidoreductase subunit NuoN n=1 Tax=Plastoroseomonas hellenica TaxID=2687306 RepID=UPI001BA4F4FB|nr:NADH-quinone oxidoreductase subunit NuoN [Plastoroseomonas hellenica]MBR0644277.1 NADH-quinone oxidoreductase subunit NuoN [Plastoroseomonas hellenica]
MNWTLALPELVLAIAGLCLLVAGVVPKRPMHFAITLGALGSFLLAAVLVMGQGEGVTFGGLYVADAFARFAKLLVLAGAGLGLILALDFNEKSGIARFEFPVLLVFATVGMMVMVSANDLMALYVGLELMSLSLYVVAAFDRDNERSSEAGLKYFVLGALASGLLLYGASLVYGFAGTTNFDRIADALSSPVGGSLGLVVGVVFVVAGLAFKVSAVPFHMWTPDVYEGAPTPVTAFFAAAPKVAAIALLTRVLAGPFGDLAAQWQQVILLISALSMILGAFAAVGQSNVKRLMAYSSIANVGYALMGLAVATDAGLRGLLLYMAVYIAMTLGSFSVLVAMRRDGRAVERIDDLAGLGRTDPVMAFWMAVFMFSMAGIPPLAGFFSKLYVFLPAVQAGYWALAVIGVLTSVVGAYYYLRIVKVMYFDAPAGAFDPRPAGLSVVLTVTGLFTMLFILFPAPLIAAAQAAITSILG